MSRARRVAALGVASLTRGLRDALRNHRLRKRHGFEKWHTLATYDLKPYKGTVVEVLNSSRRRSVAEIGCGLGDILSRCDAGIRVGVDQDERVLRAARELHPEIEFITSDLTGAAEALMDHGLDDFDTIVMVNWPHLIDFLTLSRAVKDLQTHVGAKELLIDAIADGTDGYRYCHTLEELQGLGRVTRIIQRIDSVRDLLIIELDRGAGRS